jgi:tRNA nucleotidyltransferase (CCA-adding enzyme)
VDSNVIKVCQAVRQAGGRAMLVGGSVRDMLLGRQSKDFDIEVYGVEPARLRAVLEQIAPVNTVGEHFAVYKLVFEGDSADRIQIDVSLPRRESKSGRGHRAFHIEGDPQMTFQEAARRRDFTINAMLYDPLSDQLVDPFGGAEDLKRRILRAVSPDSFIEDSLRVLRAMQLAARFELTIDPDTVILCRGIDLSDLPRERVWGEFEKLFLSAERPSLGLDAALQLGILDKLLPEVRALVGCQQDPTLHQEGDAFTHAKLCLDQAAGLARSHGRAKRVTLLMAALCHDLGKPLVGEPGHAEAGFKPTEAILDRLGIYTLDGYNARGQILALVVNHLKPHELYRGQGGAGEFRRLARKCNIELLHMLARACWMSRGAASSTAVPDWFIQRARQFGCERGAPAPILMGRHLVEMGFEPGPQMGEILRRVYEMQLDGQICTLDQALEAARKLAQKAR